MRSKLLILLSAVALLCTASAPVRAQQPPPVRNVYLTEVATSSSPSDDESKIARAATPILELRLGSMKEIKLLREAVPCEQSGETLPESPPTQRQESPGQMPLANLSGGFYEVRAAIKRLATADGTSNTSLLLDYDLLRYVRCKAVSILHRSQPISLKTAFEGLSQMSDTVELALNEELAPPKTVVDLTELTANGESLQALREQLGNAVLFKLVTEPDFRVRDLRRGKPPDSQADFIVTGELINKKDQKGVTFTIKSAKERSPPNLFVSGPVGQKNPDEKALAVFYEKSATVVVNHIRARRDNIGPLSDADVDVVYQSALKKLCKDQTGCVSQPEIVIPMLTRLRDAEKASLKALLLLGDAYIEVEEFGKAAAVYDEAWTTLPAQGTKAEDAEVVRIVSLAADAMYRAQDYRNAADRYRRAIEISAERGFSTSANLRLQYVRSNRLAGNGFEAFQIALKSLRQFPDSPELDEEIDNLVKSVPVEDVGFIYHLLIDNKDIRKINQKLPAIRARFAEYLIGPTYMALGDRKFEEAERHLKIIESFPLAAISDEQQKVYRLARAIWSMEAKNDFNTTIAILTPLSDENFELSEAVKFRLALAFYERARAAGDSADKADYARASDLLTKMPEKERPSGFYNLLLAINHKLEKDQESRRLIEEKLKSKEDDSEAMRALASLCIDYLGDLDCGETVVKQLEEHAISNSSVRMSHVRLKVLRGNYAEAEKLIDHPLRSFEDPEVIHASFYRVWTSLALAKESEAAKALGEWLTVMEKFRGASKRNYWVFDSASRGIEADQVVPANKKDLLRGMITAMLTASEPLPKAADFFPAFKAR